MIGKYNYGTGRRKNAVARVFMKPGKGQITVNDKPLDVFFSRETGRMIGAGQALARVELPPRGGAWSRHVLGALQMSATVAFHPTARPRQSGVSYIKRFDFSE